jgi:hypothetical protein
MYNYINIYINLYNNRKGLGDGVYCGDGDDLNEKLLL